ncbi:MAG: BrnA antitoxin family protein [Rhodoferax sp.]|nr:BrnA antitoxin family protein [Rhodoferax sp.]
MNIRIDAEVLDAFKATDPGWQHRFDPINRVCSALGVKLVAQVARA